MADKWIKRWKVEKSKGDGHWIVALDKDGNYGCSCPVWKFRRQECHHIVLIKNNGGEEAPAKEKPGYVLAAALKPIYKEETNELLIPLIGIPDANMMEATICFYMMKYGYSWSEVKEIRGHLPPSWTKKAVIAHVERHGEACHPKSFLGDRRSP